MVAGLDEPHGVRDDVRAAELLLIVAEEMSTSHSRELHLSRDQSSYRDLFLRKYRKRRRLEAVRDQQCLRCRSSPMPRDVLQPTRHMADNRVGAHCPGTKKKSNCEAICGRRFCRRGPQCNARASCQVRNCELLNPGVPHSRAATNG